MICNDKWIIEQAQKGMITPFEPAQVRLSGDLPVISYGVSSFGYDFRLGYDFKIFRHIPGTIIDPKNFNPKNLEKVELQSDSNGEFFVIPGHSYALGVTLEGMILPDNVTVLFLGKSTYARLGIIANVTPGEAGWRGHLTIEISNASEADCRVYAGEGILQGLFFEGEPCLTTYSQRSGKYQGQPAQIVTARV